MQIRCLKCFRFSDATPKKLETKSIIIQPSTDIQDAPDWIKSDPLFAAAVDAGDLEEVAILSKKSKTADAPKTADAVKTGWGDPVNGLQL